MKCFSTTQDAETIKNAKKEIRFAKVLYFCYLY